MNILSFQVPLQKSMLRWLRLIAATCIALSLSLVLFVNSRQLISLFHVLQPRVLRPRRPDRTFGWLWAKSCFSTGRTRQKGSGLRRCQNGCFEREGMHYTAKTCPKATSHNKRETLGKKSKHIKSGAVTGLGKTTSVSGSQPLPI